MAELLAPLSGLGWAQSALTPMTYFSPVGRKKPLHRRQAVTLSHVSAIAGLREHWIFVTVILIAVTLRVLALVAYWPAIAFYGDTYYYLANTRPIQPNSFHPAGYSVFLDALRLTTHDVASVPPVQDLIALASGIGIYLVCVHLGARRGLSALAAASLLVNAYQLDLNEMVLSESLLIGLVTICICILAWQRTHSNLSLIVAGLALAAAIMTRSDLLVLIPPLAFVASGRETGKRLMRLGIFGLALAIPIIGYCTWHSFVDGQFTIDNKLGFFLYGRVSPFAECSKLPASDQSLCDHRPIRLRPGPASYLWSPTSPFREHYRVTGFELPEGRLLKFGEDVLLAQPVSYAHTVWTDTIQYFSWDPSRAHAPPTAYYFPQDLGTLGGNVRMDTTGFPGARTGVQSVSPRVNKPIAHFLGRLDGYLFVPGTLELACIAIVLTTWIRRRRDVIATVILVSSVTLIVASTAAASYDYRYGLVTQPFIVMAGVLACRSFWWGANPGLASEFRGAEKSGSNKGTDQEGV